MGAAETVVVVMEAETAGVIPAGAAITATKAAARLTMMEAAI